MRAKRTVSLLLLTLVLFVDQLTKAWARHLSIGQLNTGGMWGVFPGAWWSLMSFLVLVLITGYLFVTLPTKNNHGWLIILAAGLSNYLDRLFFGGVWDFIYYPVLNVVGNLADVMIGLGIILVFFPNITNTLAKVQKVTK